MTIRGSWMKGIKLSFTNGFETPMYLTQDLGDVKEAKIDTTVRIKQIQMKMIADSNLNGIKLIDEKGQILCQLEGNASGEWKTQEIAEDESIIGVYGCRSGYALKGVGFIVWNR